LGSPLALTPRALAAEHSSTQSILTPQTTITTVVGAILVIAPTIAMHCIDVSADVVFANNIGNDMRRAPAHTLGHVGTASAMPYWARSSGVKSRSRRPHSMFTVSSIEVYHVRAVRSPLPVSI
jgi:hypothetical protein